LKRKPFSQIPLRDENLLEYRETSRREENLLKHGIGRITWVFRGTWREVSGANIVNTRWLGNILGFYGDLAVDDLTD